MNERVRLQLRLQHTVEGLSIAAISYYVANITELLLEGVGQYSPSLDAKAVTAGLTPFILVGVGMTIVGVRRYHRRSDRCHAAIWKFDVDGVARRSSGVHLV